MEFIKLNRIYSFHWRFPASLVICIFFYINCVSQNPVYKKYTVDDGLPSNEIYQIMQDTKGYIWLATNKGASRFDGSRFENFTIENGLPDNEVLIVSQDKQERIWFKSFTGPLSYYDGIIHNSSNTPWLKKLEFKQTVFVFTPLSDGDILIGPNQYNVLRLKDTTLEFYDSLASFNIFEERNGSILKIGSNYVIENRKKINTINSNAAPSKGLKSYYDGQQDILIIANDSGLFSYNHHEYKYIRDQDLLNIHKAWVIVTSDREGYFWVTDFTNLYRFRIDSDFSLTNVQKYFEDIPVNNIFEDKDNNFWFATKGEGLLMVPSINIRLFNKASGLEDNNVTSALRINAGNIICGTMNGFLQTINNKGKIEKPVNLQSSEIRKIIKDKNNRTIILCEKNIFYQESDVMKKISSDITSYKSLALNSKGEVLAGEYSAIRKLYNGKTDTIHLGTGSIRFYSVCEKEPGEIWAGSEKGLFVFKNDSLIPFHPEIKPFKGWIDDICKTTAGKMLRSEEH